jgi:hypothetical protein
LEQFEQAKDGYKADSIMAPMFNSGWTKTENTTLLLRNLPHILQL